MGVQIVHMTSVHPREDVRILHKECHTLASAGYDISLVVADGGGDETHGGVSIVDVGRAEGGRWKRMTTTRNRVLGRALELGAKVYHFHDPELLPAGLALIRKGKKVIYDAHENFPGTLKAKPYIPWPLRLLAAWVFGSYEMRVAKRLSAVVAATPKIADRLRQVQPRTEVVANFPLKDEAGWDVEDWGVRDSAACYLGAVSWQRGLSQMLAAVDRAGCRLFLAGRFSDEVDVEKLQRLQGWGAVEDLGVLGRSSLQAMMNRCRVGLVVLHPTSNYVDSQPDKLFEYMAAGIPVVASDFSYWRMLVGRFDCCLFVDPMDEEAIASAISWLLDHPEEAEAMGMRGREAVRVHFNWGNEEGKLLALYDSLV